MVIFKVVAYRRWLLTRSGHCERVDGNKIILINSTHIMMSHF